MDLTAGAAWQRALHDAVLAYRLGPGDALALPGFHPQQHHPAAILATLLAGATFVELTPADIAARPGLLDEQPITTLGITPGLCEALRKAPIARPPKLRQWVRSVDEPLDWVAWNELVKKNDLASVPSTNVLVDAAAGGAVLFSTRRPGSVQALALPAAGQPYTLFDATGSGEPAARGAGVFVPTPAGDPKKDGWFVLARRGTEFLWGGTLAPRRAGRAFPAAELAERAAEVPGILGACVVPIPTADPGGRWAFVLLAFAGAPPDGAPANPALSDALADAIREDLGDDFLPDRITVLPLYPRMQGRKVDAAWCQRQYSSGFLAAKAQHPVFRRLAGLRGLVLGA
ncbi:MULTISPECIES: hypothetical protein [Sorangium]|uniref:hypothetical protein n=1 Tax=Sorangium TaxID=39643 RepID=UPI003D9C1B8E